MLALAFVLGSGACGAPASPASSPAAPAPITLGAASREQRARAFVELLAKHAWSDAAARLDDKLRAGDPAATLAAFWKPLDAAGAWEGIAGVAVAHEAEHDVDVALVVCRAGGQIHVVRVTLLPGGAVAGVNYGTVAELAEPDARALVAALARGELDAAYAMLAPALRASLTERELGATWRALEQDAGELQAIERVEVEADRGARALVHARFARGARVLLVGFDERAEIAGLKVLAEGADADWDPPAYARPGSFTESRVTVGDARGVLALPAGAPRAAGVILVSRAGPQDEDEHVGRMRPLKDLAWGLASRGIAVLRYEKRARADASIAEEYLEPARAALALLRHTAGVDPSKLVVVGHGFGGSLAPKIAADDAKLAGVAVLAGPTKSLEDTWLDEVSYLSSLAPGDATLRAQVDGFKRLKREAEDPALRPDAKLAVPSGGTVSGAYILSARKSAPLAIARSLACPIFVLQGERDFQVPPSTLDAWRRALGGSPRAKLALYPRLNHLFSPGVGAPSPAEYATPSHVDARVVDDLAAWISALP